MLTSNQSTKHKNKIYNKKGQGNKKDIFTYPLYSKQNAVMGIIKGTRKVLSSILWEIHCERN